MKGMDDYNDPGCFQMFGGWLQGTFLLIGVPVIIAWIGYDILGFTEGVISVLILAYLGYMIFGYNRDKEKSKPRPSYRSSLLGPQYPSNWSDISRQARQRDGHKCGNCGSGYNLHVHHIVPLSKGGTNNLSNLRTLCSSCHGKLHPHMR